MQYRARLLSEYGVVLPKNIVFKNQSEKVLRYEHP